MKILTLVWSVGIGGVERAAVNFAIGYKHFGQDSRVLVLGGGFERLPDLIEAGVETYILQTSKKKPEELFLEIRNWAPEIIHIHNYTDGIVRFLHLLKAPNTKVVETNVFSRPRFDEGYREVSLSLQLSKWGYWKFTNCMKGANFSPQAAIIPNTVIADKFSAPSNEKVKAFLRSHKIPDGAFVVGRLGQPLPAKWSMKIIDIVARTVNPANSIYYIFVGLPENIKMALKEQSGFVQSRVRVIDRIEGDSSLALYYFSLDCFAHISKIGESFGYVLVEALICKVPVVTLVTPLRDNAQFEVVGHGIGGYCVTSHKKFAEAILHLYKNPTERIALKSSLNNWVNSRFSFLVVTPIQLKLYQQLLDGKSVSPPEVSSLVKNFLKLYGIGAPFLYLLLRAFNHRLTTLFIHKIRRHAVG